MSIRLDEAPSQLFPASLSMALNGKTEQCEPSNETSTNNEDANGSSASPEATMNAFDLDAQQKAFQRFTSSLGLGGFRSPFNMNVLPPFLAALQQNPMSLQQQLLGLTGGLSGVSPGPEEEDENENAATTEPEDLTMSFSFRKDGKIEDPSSENGGTGMGAGPTWSYEEQFKQLYELSDDLKRKEWLDDWLSFMHRIGKPVTRIPIMAKQVLDLYELYRLVVQHGGLVEIINKKLWREITKGLNLPSSITSAAFTLRTQYQKYLYDYECEKEGLSNPADLQSAIDGNRREGRRTTTGGPNFGPLGYPLPHPSSAANLLGKHLNGLGMRNDFLDDDGLGMGMQHNNLLAAYRAEQLAMFEAQQRQLERAQRAAVEAVTRQSLGVAGASASSSGCGAGLLGVGASGLGLPTGRESTSSVDSDSPAAKRLKMGGENGDGATGASNPTGGHLKITTRKPEGEQTDNSMVVSMEVNGITYQGVLFALESDPKPNSSSD